tara:strand:+ start:505 stop:1470 length:966 start_codon:yes stop_codon:yes gene_type:complete
MALPLIAVGVLGRYLLQRGGLALAKQYAKKNKKRITQALINQAKNANKNKSVTTKNIGGKGGPSKVKTNKNTTPKKKITVNKNPRKKTNKKDSFDEELKKKEGTKNFNTRNKEATTTTTKPKKEPKLTKKDKNMLDRVNKTTKKTPFGQKIANAAIGASLVGTAISFLPKGGKKTKSKGADPLNLAGKSSNTKKSSTNTVLSNKDLKNKQNMQKNKAYSLDDMLGSKQVRSVPSGFKDKKSKPKGSGTFGANISFTGNNISDLKSNARKLSSQIDALNITSMQKKRLKDELNTRKKSFGMGESYRKSFNIIKNKVKNQKFN